MNESQFWSLLDDARADAGEVSYDMVALLQDRLTDLAAEEICDFDRMLRHFISKSYSHDLWAAAYIINGGCSDDGFEYFRGWLIALGRRAYENALQDVQSLKDYIPDDPDWAAELEDILYVAQEAYEEKTGASMPVSDSPPSVLQGEEWTEDEIYTRYPELVQAAEKRWEEG